MLPEAPTRFSTTTGCPQRAASLSPTMRGSASAAPPAGNGTMTRIGRLGYPGAGSCAHAEAATNKLASHARRHEFMGPPPTNRSDRHDRILSTKISQEEGARWPLQKTTALPACPAAAARRVADS